MIFGPFRFASFALTAAVLTGLLLAPQARAQAQAAGPVHDHAHDHGPAQAPTKAGTGAFQPEAHTRADIERHRAMAKAHEAAAQCLGGGGEHEKCGKQLQADCKGLALGKYCGMRHAH